MGEWNFLGKIYLKTKKKVLTFFRGCLPLGVWPPKFYRAIKKSKFNFFVEYPTWVSIKRYLTGKLALACQNLIYWLRLNKNVQKPSKTERFQNTAIFGCFWKKLTPRFFFFFLTSCETRDSDADFLYLFMAINVILDH